MSAKWIRVETDFVDHPKAERLAGTLGDPNAGWYILRGWSWLSRFCPTGQFRDIDGTAFEEACRWRGKAGGLLEALVLSGLLDCLDTGGWEAHDWADHQGKVAATAEKERERKRAYRASLSHGRPTVVPRDNERDKNRRPAQRDVTGRDVTLKDYVEPSSTPVDLESKLTDDEFQVFEHWRTALNHPASKPTSERRRLIAKWLKVYSVADLQSAVDGCARTPWNMGENPNRKRYDSLELILRDAKHIEDFMGVARVA